MSEDTTTYGGQVNRPGCVTLYAVLLWISAGLAVLGLLLLGLNLGGRIGMAELCLAGVALPFLALWVATGIGLWQMRKWGWALVLVMHSFSIIASVLQLALAVLLAGETAIIDPTVLCGTLIGLAISGTILYWFITNRELFNGDQAYKRVVGPDGGTTLEPVEKKGSETSTIVLVIAGGAAVLILVCIVIIAMLAILGPQIGNVFSQITYTLDNPPAAVIPWL